MFVGLLLRARIRMCRWRGGALVRRQRQPLAAEQKALFGEAIDSDMAAIESQFAALSIFHASVDRKMVGLDGWIDTA